MKRLIARLLSVLISAAIVVGATVLCFLPQNVKLLCGYNDKNDSSLCKTYSAVALSLSPEITSLEMTPPEPYSINQKSCIGRIGFDITYGQRF